MNSNIPDPEQLNSMMSNPLVQQQMQAMLSDPQMLDFMIQQNPQLRAMGPEVRQMLQSPFFRQMMSNPEMLRSMMQMGRGNAEQTNAFLRQVLTLLLVKVAVAGRLQQPLLTHLPICFLMESRQLTLWHCLEVLHLLLLLLPQLTTDHQKKDTKPIKTIERYGILRF